MKGGGGEWEEDIRGQRHSGEGLLEFWERKHYFEIRTVFSVWYFFGLEFGWIVTGEHRLLGVLGSGARNPHGILELGSQIGSVPSWQGGKIRFWAEFGQSSEDRRRLEE
jgi:hypothetical protein